MRLTTNRPVLLACCYLFGALTAGCSSPAFGLDFTVCDWYYGSECLSCCQINTTSDDGPGRYHCQRGCEERYPQLRTLGALYNDIYPQPIGHHVDPCEPGCIAWDIAEGRACICGGRP